MVCLKGYILFGCSFGFCLVIVLALLNRFGYVRVFLCNLIHLINLYLWPSGFRLLR